MQALSLKILIRYRIVKEILILYHIVNILKVPNPTQVPFCLSPSVGMQKLSLGQKKMLCLWLPYQPCFDPPTVKFFGLNAGTQKNCTRDYV